MDVQLSDFVNIGLLVVLEGLLSADNALVLAMMIVAFSVVSICVAVAMSRNTWGVLAGGVVGIIAFRVVIGQLLSMVRRYPAIVDDAFIIIAWVGTKLLLEYLHAEGLIRF